MAEVVKMPKMSDTMEEGVIASWLVKEGDTVKSGDILAEVETDKATMELESYEDGTILHIGVKAGDSVPIDGIIAIIGEKGEDISDLLKENSKGAPKKEEKSNDEKDSPKEKKEKPAKSTEKIDVSDINASIIAMPKMSDTMTEGTIAGWLKKVGDKVSSGDILAEVETDKATMELEAYEDGTLLYIGPKEGESIPVDGVLAIIGEEGADYKKLLESHQQESQGGEQEEKNTEKEEKTKESKPETTKSAEPKAKSDSQEQSDDDGDRVKASPLAKKMAQEKGFDISKIKGSGDYGRIIKRDVENYKPEAKSETAPQKSDKGGAPVQLPQIVSEEQYEEKGVSQMRKAIAKRLAESKFTAPHFYLTMEIDMDKAIEARKSMNEVSPVKLSFNDLVIKAAAVALRQHPKVNSSWRGDKIRYNQHVHIGVAVAVDEGLLVPVVRFADNKTLSHISAEVKQLGEKAKNKQLQPAEWEGNTFTISNLGMFGIEEFTAIINPPDACIMAVGGIKEIPVVKNGQIVPGNRMKVTLSCDHRVVDGATGAAFLQTFKNLLEDPVRILI